MPYSVTIVGASTRSAAMSALRAGLSPWCVDRYADRDLSACCPVRRISAADYPHEIPRYLKDAPTGPWLYTGALENRPELVDRIAREHVLWGNDAMALRRIRSPHFVRKHLTAAGLYSLQLRSLADGVPHSERWLLKPLAGAGGIGIKVVDHSSKLPRRRDAWYLQELVEGDAYAAIYIGAGQSAKLLGVTLQLVGAPWLHAERFRYCGSIGPVELPARAASALESLGHVLAKACGLRGIFGVDFILRAGLPWPVEINPRYTASVEVVEHALGVASLALHRQVFDSSEHVGSSPLLTPMERTSNIEHRTSNVQPEATGVVGKAILCAPQRVVFPEEGPWQAVLDSAPALDELPAFADIPQAGERIPAGKPILTFFARGDSIASCQQKLERTAAELHGILFGD